MSGAPRLRRGYSTGACAAALAAAAWMRLAHPERPAPAAIPLLFPDGRERLLPMLPPDGNRMAAIRKDGGDDPDCTHGAVLHGGIRPCARDGIRPEDHVLAVGDAGIVVRGVAGVGLCTREGLACERGKWAVNPGPLRMIAENLRRAGPDSGLWLFEVGVDGGEKLAKKTLNSLLGVTGGLSVLGTTGLVLPYSHDAYVETVRICVRGLRRSGGRCAVFCTGGRTLEGARRMLPDLPENAFIRMGDFVAEALRSARRNGMRSVVVACMPGKLCKYASGPDNTHARSAEQDISPLRDAARRVTPHAADFRTALEDAVSVRGALAALPEEFRAPVLRVLAGAALERLASRCGDRMDVRLAIFGFDGEPLFDVLRPAPAGAVGEPEIGDDDLLEEDAGRRDEADVGYRYFVDGPNAPAEGGEA